ncbi:MAG: hypothetical protein OXH70_12980 [Acidobacteria bacterium]|nr:hypothetical protein [Acidobacteriota bacterium]
MGNASPLARIPIPAPAASGRWRRFRWSSRPPEGRRLPPSLSWRDLLNRRDALVFDIRSSQAADFSETLQVALIDTTGAARFVAMGRRLNRSTAPVAGTGAARTEAEEVRNPRGGLPWAGDARPWSEVHGHLVRAFRTAGVVLAWDAPSKAQLLVRTAWNHGLRPPAIPWRDFRDDYERFGYPGNSLTVAARRHVNGGFVPGPLAPCHLALAVMRARGC